MKYPSIREWIHCSIFIWWTIRQQWKEWNPNIYNNWSKLCNRHQTQNGLHYWFISQFSSVAQSCPTLCDPMNCSTPGLPVHHQLPELTQLMSIELVMPSSHLILGHPLLFLLPIPPSIRVFSNESTLHMRWPKYWSFIFSINPSNEHPGLISFRINWMDLLAVQGTLKSLLQHHSSKASILWRSAFFTV